MATSQKDAVIAAVKSVVGEIPAGTAMKGALSKDQLSTVQETVFNGIMDGSIDYSKDKTDAKLVRKYVNGMVDNYLRKAKELNGGNKYVAVSNRTPKDAQLAELKKLASTMQNDPEKLASVNAAIAEREASLRAAKVSSRKAKTAPAKIDATILPDELKDLA